jgi:hypothetical protein
LYREDVENRWRIDGNCAGNNPRIDRPNRSLY